MGRKRTGLIEDIFDMLQQLPWWVGVASAGIIWVVGSAVTGVASDDPMRNALRPLLRFAVNGFALVCLAGAIVSAVKSKSRRRLLDRQRGIDSVRALSWQQFEQLVGEAYRRQGYTIEETGGGGADGGIDLVLRGKGVTILVQCKRWRTQRVGVDKVRELFGVLTAHRATRGILVSSGRFTKEARAFAAGKPLDLVDGPALTQLIRNVQPAQTASISVENVALGPDTDECPHCGSPMVRRTAKRGAHAGSDFYGCTRYPACKGIRSVA